MTAGQRTAKTGKVLRAGPPACDEGIIVQKSCLMLMSDPLMFDPLMFDPS